MAVRRPYAVGALVAAVIVITGVVFGVAMLGSTPAAELLPTATPAASLGPSPTAPPTPTERPSPLPTPAPEWLGSAILEERFTVLILGTDRNAARHAAGKAPLTDAIMVVSVNPDQDEVLVLSVPRDTVDIPLEDGNVWTRKVNEIYHEQGGDGMRRAMETFLELDIDRYVAVSMDEFRVLIDAVGGVTIDVEISLSDGSVGFHLPAGTQTLDGFTALRYARHRVQGGDYGRAARHQQIVVALAEKFASGGDIDIAKLISLAALTDTDVTVEDLPALLELTRRVADAEVIAVVLRPPDHALFEGVAGERGWIMIPDVDAIRDVVVASTGE